MWCYVIFSSKIISTIKKTANKIDYLEANECRESIYSTNFTRISSSLSTQPKCVLRIRADHMLCSQRQVRFNLCSNISDRMLGNDSLWMLYVECGWKWVCVSFLFWFGWTKDFPISEQQLKNHSSPWNKSRNSSDFRRPVILENVLSFYLFRVLHLLERGEKTLNCWDWIWCC